MLTTFTVNVDYDTDSWVDTDQEVTLREAVERAENNLGADIILFDPDLNGETITLGIDDQGMPLNFTSTQGDLDITESLTIDASALSSGITIDASGNDPTPTQNNGDGSRVFNIVLTPIAGDSFSITFDNLTIQGGDTSSNGGGINFVIDDNSADVTASFSILNSTIQDNYSSDTGGGINFFAEVNATTNVSFRVIDSQILNNKSAGTGGNSSVMHTSWGGGGIAAILRRSADASATPGVVIQRSTISGNTNTTPISGYNFADGGGGLLIDTRGFGTSISDSIISGNDSPGFGGGLSVKTSGYSATDQYGIFELSNSTISNNGMGTVAEHGGGISVLSYDSEVIIAETIITGNKAEKGGGGYIRLFRRVPLLACPAVCNVGTYAIAA